MNERGNFKNKLKKRIDKEWSGISELFEGCREVL